MMFDRFQSGPSGVDPYFGNVVLLMHCEGANGSTTFTDSSSYARTMTGNGSPTITTAQFQIGSASLNIPDGASWVQSNTASELTLLQQFTYEEWIRFDSANAGVHQYPLQIKDGAGGNENTELSTSGGIHTFKISFLGNTPSITILADTWYYWAVSRDSSNVVRTYFQGSLIDTHTIATARTGNTTIYIGEYTGLTGQYGERDEIRLTNGACRYTGASIPIQSGPWPNH